MSTIDASELLRPGLLQGVSIVLAGAPADLGGEEAGQSLAGEVRGACAGLGARVLELSLGDSLDGGGGEPELDGAVKRLLVDLCGESAVLVIDGAGLFTQALASAGLDGGSATARVALRVCLAASWSATHVLANRVFLPNGRGGRIVYLLPGGDAGEHANAARSGLENLARTLSIEWARHRITTVAVIPASGTDGEDARGVAALTAYLASPAGDYFSGCLLDLRSLDVKQV
jgi:NAD(P)-dependent dehydrogenase (short-subunit alcohol dehydrogenase family)